MHSVSKNLGQLRAHALTCCFHLEDSLAPLPGMKLAARGAKPKGRAARYGQAVDPALNVPSACVEEEPDVLAIGNCKAHASQLMLYPLGIEEREAERVREEHAREMEHSRKPIGSRDIHRVHDIDEYIKLQSPLGRSVLRQHIFEAST
eukprot:scaffold12881_cov22-Tisochrysis_lutea.AAC.3